MKRLILPFLLFHACYLAAFAGNAGFRENRGQLNGDGTVLYYREVDGAMIAFRRAGFSIVLTRMDSETPSLTEPSGPFAGRVHRIDFDFVEVDDSLVLIPESPAEAYDNYNLTYSKSSFTQIREFARLTYRNVLPGIDVVFHSGEKGLKYDIELAPEANLDALRLKIRGADAISVDANGRLVMETSLGPLVDELPAAWDMETERQIPVSARYVLEGDELHYAIEGHKTGRTMVIDPFSSWATFLGGNNFDYGRGITFDGTVYMAGETASPDFPASVGASQATLAGGRDAFLTAFSSGGVRLWTTYLGGAGTDVAEDVATDPAGNIVIAGHCTTTMPVTPGCFQATHAGGGFDGFIARFTNAGALIWCTHLGGEDDDHVMDVAVNSAGEIAVGGYSRSSFQVSTPGVVQATRTGGFDAMVMKFDNAGNRLWGTYFGGTSTEYGRGIDFDGLGNIITVGETYSTNYPTGASAGNSVFQAANAGGVQDMFAFKLNPTGTTRLWSTYVGGAAGTDRAFAVSADAANNVYVAGNSFGGFPVTPGVIQTVYGGGTGDGAVIKLAATGARMWASYVGGTQYDLVMSVDAVSTTDVILGGETQSAWVNVNNCTVTCGGSSNFCGFVSHLNANGTSRIMSSILGGTSNFNSVLDVNADANSNIYVTGFTNSNNYPVGGTVFQNTYGGGSSDAFLGTYNATSCWLIVLDRNQINLSAEWKGENAQLEWHSLEKGDQRDYTVERSWDGNDFHVLGTVKGEMAAGLRRYTFEDTTPGAPSRQSVWYRIRLDLPNGEVGYSEQVLLERESLPGEIVVFPNPVRDRIYISGLPSSEKIPYRLFDLNGILLLSGTLTADDAMVPVEGLPEGMYVLAMTVAGKPTRAIVGVFH